MSFFRDKQIKAFCLFLFVYALLLFATGFFAGIYQVDAAREMYLSQARVVSSSLLEQGIPEITVAKALTGQSISEEGSRLVSYLGLEGQKDFPALVLQFQNSTFISVLLGGAILVLVLGIGAFIFLWGRKGIYLQAEKVLEHFINGDYSQHLPQNKEGSLFRMFMLVEQLATMLQTKNETERKTKEFLKSTISDISHQLKTPLAALTMYQEIIENEPDNVEAVKEFSLKMGTALKRMGQLIGAMLKLTRLDAGNIIFEKRPYLVTEVVDNAISELTTRARSEGKQIIMDGDKEQILVCDIEWTGEAIGNIVKNALDHTDEGGVIHITWEDMPTMLQVFISDNGSGIKEEDIHHIFKRFYRGKNPSDTPGIGLGLPLARSIVEGQGGSIFVKSDLNKGTVFTLSFFMTDPY